MTKQIANFSENLSSDTAYVGASRSCQPKILVDYGNSQLTHCQWFKPDCCWLDSYCQSIVAAIPGTDTVGCPRQSWFPLDYFLATNARRFCHCLAPLRCRSSHPSCSCYYRPHQRVCWTDPPFIPGKTLHLSQTWCHLHESFACETSLAKGVSQGSLVARCGTEVGF